jgi:hypothetical protein
MTKFKGEVDGINGILDGINKINGILRKAF